MLINFADPPPQGAEWIEAFAAARAELDRWDRVAARQVGVPPPLSAADRPITVRYLSSGFRLDADERIFATWAADVSPGIQP